MGVSTEFFTPKDLTFAEFVQLVETTLEVKTEHHRYEDEMNYGNIGFDYNGEDRQLHFHRHNYDYDKETPHTLMSFGQWGSSVEILTKIGQQLGGWLDENDCDDEPNVYIEKTEKGVEIPPTNRQKLFALVYNKFDSDESNQVLRFLKENKAAILECNFGED
jgi:hypothetical protein